MAYKMPSGRFRAEKMIRGKRKTAVFDTREEALIWELSQKKEDWDKKSGKIVTALWAADEYLDDVVGRMVHKTYLEKKQAFRILFLFVAPNAAVETITTAQAARALNAQYKERGGNAANGDRKNLVAWWNWCKKRLGVTAENPFKPLDKFPEDMRPRVVPTAEEIQTIIDTEKGEKRTLILTLLHTAARRGEVFAMRWDDLDFERRTVRLWTRKRKGGGRESNLIPMTEELRTALMEHKKTARSVFVFCQENGQPLTGSIRWVKRGFKVGDGEPFGFHGIRHLSASMLDAAGVGLAVIQMILRHKSAVTTDLYMHSLRGVKVDLDGVFSAKDKAHKHELVSL